MMDLGDSHDERHHHSLLLEERLSSSTKRVWLRETRSLPPDGVVTNASPF